MRNILLIGVLALTIIGQQPQLKSLQPPQDEAEKQQRLEWIDFIRSLCQGERRKQPVSEGQGKTLHGSEAKKRILL